jgi:3',5'-cyclic AMP phosphodiesterase CpdA
MLAAAVAAARAIEPRPNAVLLSGDLADHAADAEYELVKELLAPLNAPLYVLPGNHDDRQALRRHFRVAGVDGQPVQYATEVGPMRLVMLDTTRPGEDRGELGADRLAWLDEALGAATEVPTLVAMHHTPLETGIAAWDELGLPVADCQALAEIVSRHPQVRRIAAGHVHRTISADLGGRGVLTVPSTYVQGRLDFAARELLLSSDPPGFAVHVLIDGEIVSHIQPVQ